MKKNVAGQRIGCQAISASDGSAFTGSVTVYVTGDAGTQAVGSVGSGACTHEGNGYHTYAPAQAETNYDLAAFTFIGSGMIPVTVQVFTTFPQTGDSFARLGAPAGASVSADVAAVKVDTAATLVDTAEIGAAGAGLTALASAANLATVDTVVDAIKAKTDNLPASPAAVGDIPTALENADALLTRDMSDVDDTGSPTVRMPLDALRHIRNRFDTTVVPGWDVIYKEDDTTEAWRQELGTDPSAEPITSTNPS